MEIFDAVLNGKLRGPIKKVKKIQTILGDLHDCDVWDDDIANFIEQEKQRTIDYYGHARPFARILPGLDYLRDQRQQCRGRLLIEAREYFEKLEAEQFWDMFLNDMTELPKDDKEQEFADDACESDTAEEPKPEPQLQPENSDPL